jgi:hypothetical protein
MSQQNIITIILKKYSENYSEKEITDEFNNYDNKNEKLDFKKLLLEVNKIQDESKCNFVNKELILDKNIKVKNIDELNFIQDINLVDKIVQYRKLEIKKQIRIINRVIEFYKNILTKINCYNYYSNEINENNLQNNILLNIVHKLNIVQLNTYKQKCINIFNDFIFNNANFLKNTLCRYVDLETSLKSIKEKLNQNK